MDPIAELLIYEKCLRINTYVIWKSIQKCLLQLMVKEEISRKCKMKLT